MRVVHPSLYMKRLERKKRKEKKRYIWYVVLLLTIITYGVLVYMVKPSYAPVTQEVGVEHQNVTIRWPSTGSASVGGLDYEGSLASIRGDVQVSSASTIKLLTALVVLDQKPLGAQEPGEAIYFGAPDAIRYNETVDRGGAALSIPTDTTITYREALDAMLVTSANNIADKLAIWAFGSEEAYLKAAKIYTVTHGLNQTIVTDASGLLSSTKTSSMDMARIARLAALSPVISAVVNQQVVALADGRELKNTNDLLGIDGITGLKTGNTPDAGFCLVASRSVRVQDRDKVITATVFGQSSHDAANQAIKDMLDDTAAGYEVTSVAGKNQAVAYYQTPWGAKVEVRPKDGINVHRWKGVGVSAVFDLQPLSGAKEGDVVGKLVMGKEAFPLVIAGDLPHPSLWWRFKHALDFIEIKI